MVLAQINNHVPKKIEFDQYFVLYVPPKNSKYITDLNVKLKTTKLLHENLCDIGLGKDFLNITPKVQSTIEETVK